MMARSNAERSRSLPMPDIAKTKPMTIREKVREYSDRTPDIALSLLYKPPIPQMDHVISVGGDICIVCHQQHGQTQIAVQVP